MCCKNNINVVSVVLGDLLEPEVSDEIKEINQNKAKKSQLGSGKTEASSVQTEEITENTAESGNKAGKLDIAVDQSIFPAEKENVTVDDFSGTMESRGEAPSSKIQRLAAFEKLKADLIAADANFPEIIPEGKLLEYNIFLLQVRI